MVAAALTDHEQRYLVDNSDVVRRAVFSICKCRCRGFDVGDLIQQGLVEFASWLVRWRTEPKPDNVRGFLYKRIRAMAIEYATENRRAVRVPHQQLWRAENNKPDSRGSHMSEANRRRTIACGKRDPESELALPRLRVEDTGHSEEWLHKRGLVHSALILTLHHWTGLERRVGEALLLERLTIAEAAFRTPVPHIARRFGLSWDRVRCIERSLLRSARDMVKGTAKPSKPIHPGKARSAIQRAGTDGRTTVLAIVGVADASEALAVATIAAGRILAPASARLAVADLAAALQISPADVKRIEADLIGQAVRILGLRGVAA